MVNWNNLCHYLYFCKTNSTAEQCPMLGCLKDVVLGLWNTVCRYEQSLSRTKNVMANVKRFCGTAMMTTQAAPRQ